jgi:hypothetical protein
MATADPAKKQGDFVIPVSKIYLAEGNSNQTRTPAVNQYFQDILQLLNDRGLAGIQFFISDTLADAKDAKGQPTLAPALSVYDLFVTHYTPAGTRTYGKDWPPGISWH